MGEIYLNLDITNVLTGFYDLAILVAKSIRPQVCLSNYHCGIILTTDSVFLVLILEILKLKTYFHKII